MSVSCPLLLAIQIIQLKIGKAFNQLHIGLQCSGMEVDMHSHFKHGLPIH